MCVRCARSLDDLKNVQREGKSRPRTWPLPRKSYCCSDILAELVKLMRYTLSAITYSDIKSPGLILSWRAFPITSDTLVGGNLRSMAHSLDYSLPVRVSFFYRASLSSLDCGGIYAKEKGAFNIFLSQQVAVVEKAVWRTTIVSSKWVNTLCRVLLVARARSAKHTPLFDSLCGLVINLRIVLGVTLPSAHDNRDRLRLSAALK